MHDTVENEDTQMKHSRGRRYSFVDLRGIWDIQGLVQRFHAADKRPGPVLEADKPWEKCGTSLPSVVYRDGRFQMWYQVYGMSPDDIQGNPDVIAYAESDDGVHWEKPDLGLLELNGSKRNNLPTLFGLAPSVFAGPEEGEYAGKLLAMSMPSAGPYPEIRVSARLKLPQQVKASPNYMEADLRGKPGRLHIDNLPADPVTGDRIVDPYGGWLAWVSDDGLDWRLVQRETVIPATPDSGAFVYDRYRKQYLGAPKMEVQIGDHIRRCIASSAAKVIDDWEKPRLSVVPDEMDDMMAVQRGFDAADVYAMALYPCSDLIIGILQVFYVTGPYVGPFQRVFMHGVIEPQVCYSFDGFHWQRSPGRHAFIPLGKRGELDCGMIQPSSVVEIGEDIYIYFTADGHNHGSNSRNKSLHPDHSSTAAGFDSKVCLATIKRDRFASLSAYQEGWVEIKLDVSTASELYVNATTTLNGYIAAEIRNTEGQVLEGFSRDECMLVIGDHLRAPMRWKRKGFADLPSGPVILRFYALDADIFAYEIDGTEQ